MKIEQARWTPADGWKPKAFGSQDQLCRASLVFADAAILKNR